MTRRTLSGLLFLFTLSAFSWAEQRPIQVVPPVVQGSTEVPYPDGARGDAVVVLELSIDKDGTVNGVEVVEGAEPFVERARSTVLGWRLEPARRGDTPVAARILARIEFRQESEAASAVTSAPPGPGPSTAADSSPDAPEERAAPPEKARTAPEEVTVRGIRREIGTTTLSAADVRQTPGAFGDPFRAVEVLPGVTPALSGVPYFFVRGAPPNDNGYFLDGIKVPFLFHVGLGPGVVHPSLLERVDFYPGVAPVSYGGVAGAIVAGHTHRPAPQAHGEASLRLVDAGALLESPFADGRGTALVAGRYGYPGPIISAISDVRLGYWDYQTRLGFRVSDRGRIGLFAFGSHDYLGHLDDRGTTVEDLVSDFHRVDLRYDHESATGRVRVAGTLGYDFQGSNPVYLVNHSAAVRVELERDIVPTFRLRAGADARLEAFAVRHEEPGDAERTVVPSNAEPPRTNVTTAAHADFVWRPVPAIELVPGARVTHFDSTRARAPVETTPRRTSVLALDPRVSTRVTVMPRLFHLSTFGIAHQLPTLRVGPLPSVVAAGAGFPAGSSELQRVVQASQGLELVLPARIVVNATAFLSRSSGLTDLTASCIQIEPPIAPAGEGPRPSDPFFCPSNESVRGHAHGIELLVRRSLGERLGGLLSYTLSRSVREAHFVTLEGGENVATVPSDFDRTHVLNAILAYDLGRWWKAGTRFVFYSGVPYSRLSGNVPVPPYHDRRDPPFFRLDVRLEKRWVFGDQRAVAFVFEGQNVTLSRDANTLGMDCRGDLTPEQYTTQCERGKVGPITIPSVGVEAFF